MLARALGLTVLLLLAALLPSAVARAENPVLEGTVGTNDAFVISLVDASGVKVTHLDPGTYTIHVHDRSDLAVRSIEDRPGERLHPERRDVRPDILPASAVEVGPA